MHFCNCSLARAPFSILGVCYALKQYTIPFIPEKNKTLLLYYPPNQIEKKVNLYVFMTFYSPLALGVKLAQSPQRSIFFSKLDPYNSNHNMQKTHLPLHPLKSTIQFLTDYCIKSTVTKRVAINAKLPIGRPQMSSFFISKF